MPMAGIAPLHGPGEKADVGAPKGEMEMHATAAGTAPSAAPGAGQRGGEREGGRDEAELLPVLCGLKRGLLDPGSLLVRCACLHTCHRG
jgi:hypothetical protein